MGNERAPGAASGSSGKDMALQNADGPVRAGGGNAANAEASLFNKHYNKELKLCEGKWIFDPFSMIFLLTSLFLYR